MKFGKVKIVREPSSMMSGTCEAEIFVFNVKNRNIISTAVTNDTHGSGARLPYKVNTYRGINPENEESLLIMLEAVANCEVRSYEWIEPLAEV